MLNKLSEIYLRELDRYIEKNLNSITCGEVRDCYQSFLDVSMEITGIHQNYKSLPEYLVHRFMYYLCKNQIDKSEYRIETNQKCLNHRQGKNEIDIALVDSHIKGNIVGEPKILRGISVKAAQTVKIDEDSYRAHNLIWGKNKDMSFVLVTFNDSFNKKEDEYVSDKYKIINLERDDDNKFVDELKIKLQLFEIGIN
ncbi:hypothetical protein [Bacillus cereus]|uniref:BsaWI restriction endonuclease type 2 domain-containing protein n=1 Tax=Bacillus cereus TaxID=1396 RepID=A0A2A7HTU0_BACCE|nr:hypothetical protein [Bacillus cereus]PEC20406.1 hypothetical protein COM96_19410 [Bacillus cereus]